MIVALLIRMGADSYLVYALHGTGSPFAYWMPCDLAYMVLTVLLNLVYNHARAREVRRDTEGIKISRNNRALQGPDVHTPSRFTIIGLAKDDRKTELNLAKAMREGLLSPQNSLASRQSQLGRGMRMSSLSSSVDMRMTTLPSVNEISTGRDMTSLSSSVITRMPSLPMPSVNEISTTD